MAPRTFEIFVVSEASAADCFVPGYYVLYYLDMEFKLFPCTFLLTEASGVAPDFLRVIVVADTFCLSP